jgi:hypothetical protein
MQRSLRILKSILLAAFVLLGPAVSSAWACPFCGEANATDQNRSNAYQLSILFMLAMPALIFSGFAIGFYRLSRKAAAMQQAAESESLDPVTTEGG